MISLVEKSKSVFDTNHPPPRRGSILIKKLNKHNKKFRYLHNTYDVIELTDPKELERSITYHKPDLILFEASPKNSSIDTQTCKSLNKNSSMPLIPVILIAKEHSIDCYKLCRKIGADAYLKDNFQLNLLPILIESLIQSRKNLLKPNSVKSNTHYGFEDTGFLLKINQLISDNLDDPGFNVASLCDGLAMSRSMVYKKLKAAKGQSIIEYIRTRKIDEAVQLLQTKKYKIFEVAFMVGFSSQKYFRKRFVQRFGFPPSKMINSKNQ